jgi:hypothetical protein
MAIETRRAALPGGPVSQLEDGLSTAEASAAAAELQAWQWALRVFNNNSRLTCRSPRGRTGKTRCGITFWRAGC